MRKYATLEAPSALGHIPEHLGVERAPGAPLAAGLADGLNARHAGRVEAEGEPDPAVQGLVYAIEADQGPGPRARGA